MHLRVFCLIIHVEFHACQMKRAVIYILLLLPFAVFVSCGRDGRVRDVLRTADSLLETRPDSALQLLRRDSAVFAAAGRAVRMGSVLTRTEAEDKLYVTHRSDTAILPAAEYFSRRGPEVQSVRAWYFLGRVYYDMKLYGRALSAFDNALAVKTDSDSVVCRYKARAATWAGAVYEEKSLHSDALRYNKTAYGYALHSDVHTTQVYTLRDIGRSYSNLKNNDTAIPYYLRAAEKAKELGAMSLYNIVMDELAGIYIEEDKFDDARRALSTSFQSKSARNMAAHYFIWAMYFEGVGRLDSAIAYNKYGMSFADEYINRDVSLDMAKLYCKQEKYKEALRYYEKYSVYSDSINANRVLEYDDLLSHVEKMVNIERKNSALANEKMYLVILISVIIVVVITGLFIIIRYYFTVKKNLLEQQKRVKKYLRYRHKHEIQNINRNKKKIEQLKKELFLSNEKLTELRKSLMRNEAELLAIKNEQMLFEQKHRELLVVDLVETEVYKLYHNSTARPTSADYHKLIAALNKAYNNFTQRLKDFYPAISDNEIWICCMIKIVLTPKDICNISYYTFSSLSMAKSRLYKKMFNKNGSARDLDLFIRNF